MRVAEVILLLLVFVGAPGWGAWRVARRRLLRHWQAEQDDTERELRQRLYALAAAAQLYLDGAEPGAELAEELTASGQLLEEMERRDRLRSREVAA